MQIQRAIVCESDSAYHPKLLQVEFELVKALKHQSWIQMPFKVRAVQKL